MHALSCTIIAFNEGDRIARCLTALSGIADEIIVIDSGSTDDTRVVCERFGATVIHNPWPGYGPQKRFAEDHARNDWILNLDADEVLTDRLRSEILAWKTEGAPLPVGFRFKFVTVYPGHETPRFRADYHDYIRLYDRRKMRFRDSLTHDAVVAGDHTIGRFSGDCRHESFRSLDHLAGKLERYTDLQAQELRKPMWQLILRRPFEFPILFVRYYFVRGHVFGGVYGFKVALIVSKIRASRISKMIKAAKAKNSE